MMQLNTMTLYKVGTIVLKLGEVCVFPQCGTTCTYEHAGLNCASCLNSITPGSTQVLCWKHRLLDGVIRPAVHFIVYTPQNGDICEKANKNIPGAKNAPGISCLYTWLRFLECTRVFLQNLQRVDIDPVLVNATVFCTWSTGPLNCRGLVSELFRKWASTSSNVMVKWMELHGECHVAQGRQWRVISWCLAHCKGSKGWGAWQVYSSEGAAQPRTRSHPLRTAQLSHLFIHNTTLSLQTGHEGDDD